MDLWSEQARDLRTRWKNEQDKNKKREEKVFSFDVCNIAATAAMLKVLLVCVYDDLADVDSTVSCLLNTMKFQRITNQNEVQTFEFRGLKLLHLFGAIIIVFRSKIWDIKALCQISKQCLPFIFHAFSFAARSSYSYSYIHFDMLSLRYNSISWRWSLISMQSTHKRYWTWNCPSKADCHRRHCHVFKYAFLCLAEIRKQKKYSTLKMKFSVDVEMLFGHSFFGERTESQSKSDFKWLYICYRKNCS